MKRESRLDESHPEASASSPQRGPLVAVCVNDTHPALRGRVLVSLDDQEVWVPVLQGLVVRVGDRVILNRPSNWPEPIVVGVVDGIALRTEPPKRSAKVVELKDDEALTVLDQRGRPMFELRGGAEGPTLACLSENLSVAVDGELRLEGRRVSIRAKEGEARIEASDDVVVEGEHIHLN